MFGAIVLAVLVIVFFRVVLKKALEADRHSLPRANGIDRGLLKQLADYAERVSKFYD